MSSVIFLVFVILFILFLFGMFSMSEKRAGPNPAQSYRPRPAKTEGITSAAREAMRGANYVGGREFVNITDIGLMAYRNPDEPKVIRYGEVMTDTAFLRPFVEVWLPHPARGPVRFELLDHEGRLRYADEAHYNLVHGQNTLLPGTWLPLQGKSILPNEWRLRVLAGSTLLGVHTFTWKPVGGGEIQRYTASDGEISPSLQQALTAQSGRPISLDDLLASQDE